MQGRSTLFFDEIAESWDSLIEERDHRAIETILQRIDIRAGDSIVDVGSGTGIMIPYYRRYGVDKIKAIDSSPGMVSVLKGKFPDLDVECRSFNTPHAFLIGVDKIVIFNAFPHLEDLEAVFEHSHSQLKEGGLLVIAHSMNREQLNAFHREKVGVHKDMLPKDDFFRQQFLKKGFDNIIVEDGEDYFLAFARKK
jgi:trans-aconitate methyltransferase